MKKQTENIADDILSIYVENYNHVLGRSKRPLWIVLQAVCKNIRLKCGWGIYAITKIKREALIELAGHQKRYGDDRIAVMRKYVRGEEFYPRLPIPPTRQACITSWHLPSDKQLVSAGFYFGWLIWYRVKNERVWKIGYCSWSEDHSRARCNRWNEQSISGTKYVVQKQIRGDRVIVRPASYFKQ